MTDALPRVENKQRLQDESLVLRGAGLPPSSRTPTCCPCVRLCCRPCIGWTPCVASQTRHHGASPNGLTTLSFAFGLLGVAAIWLDNLVVFTVSHALAYLFDCLARGAEPARPPATASSLASTAWSVCGAIGTIT
jgi:hypothetical protein